MYSNPVSKNRSSSLPGTTPDVCFGAELQKDKENRLSPLFGKFAREVVHMCKEFVLGRILKSVAAIGLVLLFVAPAGASTSVNPLKMFKRYFGYNLFIASNGVGLRGTGVPDPTFGGQSLAKGTIQVQIPQGAVVVSAFVYAQVLEKTTKPSSAVAYLRDPNVENPALPAMSAPPNPDPKTFGNNPVLTYPATIYGKPLGNINQAPCTSSGGSTGSSNGAGGLRIYRWDVMRYLKLDANNARVPIITFEGSDSGSNGGGVPLMEGASLVVVYRDVNAIGGSLRSAVIFDGAATLNNDTDAILQTINGFDQASGSPANAKIGYIVGDGQSFPEQVWIGKDVPSLAMRNDISFSGSSVPNGPNGRWDDLKASLSTAELPAGASSVTTRIDHAQGAFDCLTFSAIWVNTNVIDDDEDGLLNVWETPAAQGGGFRDPAWPCLVNHTICDPLPTGNLLLDLSALGANPQHKDLFVESDFMQEYTTNALDPTDPNSPKSVLHSHDLRLKPDVVQLIGDAFKNALEVPNPDGNPGISFHLDAGPPLPNDNNYFISAQGLEGGDPVDERWPFYYCTSGTPNCKYPNQPGIVHWALGLPILQGALAPTLDPNGAPVIPLVISPACKTNPAAAGCKRYFNEDERGLVFRYLFMGHDFAAEGSPLPGGGFSTRKVSGHANHPGNTAVITVGGWTFSAPNVQVGDTITLAAVILHEVAHLIGGNHGGTVTGINCNPNDQSVLNYLYVRGLPKANGALAVDLSHGVLNPVHIADENENAMQESFGLGPGVMPYSLISYVPVANVNTRLGLKNGNTVTAAKRYCGGPPANTGVVRTVLPGVLRSPIDWNYNGKIDVPPPLDIDNNGNKTDTTATFTLPTTDPNNFYNGDWAYINHIHGL
jgi:hypothetical protein